VKQFYQGGVRLVAELISGEGDGALACCCQYPEVELDEFSEGVDGRTTGISGGARFGRNLWIEVSEDGEELVAEFVAGEGLVVVGVVVGEVDVCKLAEIKSVLVGDAEHRANDGEAFERPCVVDTCETSWPGPSGQVHEHCFELVVGVVARCDVVEIVLVGDLGEGVVAGDSGVVFGVALLIGDVDRSFNEPASEIVSELCGRVPVQGGQLWGAEVVDDVGDGWFGVDQGENGSEGYGIGTAGASDEGLAVCIGDG